MSDLLGEEYRKMYDGYYAGDPSSKRALGARDSVRQIRRVVGHDKFQRIVDVGAGEGSVLAILNEDGLAKELYALEISGSGIDAITNRKLSNLVECKAFDGYTIPYRDKFFDLALSTHVLEHVEHERLVLRELGRVAQRVLVVVPMEGHLRVANSISLSAPHGHINFYRPETVKNLIETSHLRVIRSDVDCYSIEYERLIAGQFKGTIKYLIRRALLGLSPMAATSLLTHIGAFYCESNV